MRIRITVSVLILSMILSVVLVSIGCTGNTNTKKDSTEKVVLTLESWRVDDLEVWTQLKCL